MAKPPQVCELCQTPFVPGLRASYRPPARFCSKSCGVAWRNGARPPYIRRQARDRTPRPCEICGEPYEPTYREQRTCSRDCGVELRRRQGTIGTGGEARRKRWPSCRICVRDCACCGKAFIGRVPKAKYCSRRCSNSKRLRREPRCECGQVISPARNKCDVCLARSKAQAKQRKRRTERARKRGIKREPYTLTEIAQRDRYRCGLCGKRVAMTKTVPHPKAPTIDHVLPVACGGDDTRANVQVAHFICNARKRIGGSQQLALIG